MDNTTDTRKRQSSGAGASDAATPWHPPGHVEPNPVGLKHETAQKIIPELDKHLASLFTLFHQYQKHHWLVEGPQFRDLHLFLEDSYNEVHKELDMVAERITLLGGIPTSSPAAQQELAYIDHEPEGAFRIRPMLERDRAHERLIAQHMRETIVQATKEGDFGTETLLKAILVKVEDRAHHLDHFLNDDSLGFGLEAPMPEE